jgi:hypothetical protein
MTALEKVKRELERLGGKLGEPQASPEFLACLSVVDVTHRTSWEKVDPAGQLVDVSLAIRTFDAIVWPNVPYSLPDIHGSGRVDRVAFYGRSDRLPLPRSHRRR